MNNNYYLKLLYTKTKELKNLLEEANSNNFSNDYKKYLIAGYIITLDSILEIGISDLHSSDFDEVTSLIYYTRQKVVHYGYFNGLHNIEKTADKIINLVETNYEKEQEYYNNLFNLNSTESISNIVVGSSVNIEEDDFFYKFKSKDGKQVLCVPIKKVFKLTQKSKEKVDRYIIDTDFPIAIYSYDNYRIDGYKEIYDDEIKSFLRDNFDVVDENYIEHIQVINEIISSFVTNPINSIQIMEYSSNDQFCRNTIDVIKEFVLENSMVFNYIKNNHLIKDKYSINRMKSVDYTKLQNFLRKNVINCIDHKDAFFIDMTIKRAKYYINLLSTSTDSFDFDIEILCPILIQLFETGPKHFSDSLIKSHPEFHNCYDNLLRYRQIFSHYLLSNKEYRDGLQNFKKEFSSLIKILSSLDLSQVKKSEKENYNTYNIIERNKNDFFNYKHEQYLKVDNSSYIGKKILYSSRNSRSKSYIALIPGGQGASNVLYYKKNADNYLIPEYTVDHKSNKKTYISTQARPLKDAKEVKFDTNLSNLFKAYSELRKIKANGTISILFNATESNKKTLHYDHLETVILRYFNQGYLPVELLQKTKLNTSRLKQGVVELLSMDDVPIAMIVNEKKYDISKFTKKEKDGTSFFSRIDNIPHDFSKRRHSK